MVNPLTGGTQSVVHSKLLYGPAYWKQLINRQGCQMQRPLEENSSVLDCLAAGVFSGCQPFPVICPNRWSTYGTPVLIENAQRARVLKDGDLAFRPAPFWSKLRYSADLSGFAAPLRYIPLLADQKDIAWVRFWTADTFDAKL